MQIALIDGTEGVELEAQMLEFEQVFRYPLGAHDSFRILHGHGKDYSLFFRAQGECAVFVARDEERILGSVAACVRKLCCPDGRIIAAAYLCDLKVLPGSTRALLRLLKALQAWCEPRVEAAFAVVMQGTAITPDKYSGRLGLRKFTASGGMRIIQVASRTLRVEVEASACIVEVAQAIGIFESIGDATCVTLLGNSMSPCSLMEPIWIASACGSAVGRLEDTRRGKRLFKESGEEMFNCHLTNFRFKNIEAAISVVEKAQQIARNNGFGGVFISLNSHRFEALKPFLSTQEHVNASATVYGTDMLCGSESSDWYIHSSEV